MKSRPQRIVHSRKQPNEYIPDDDYILYKYKKSNEGDIGMAKYEKQVEQEAAYPIPISLYNCYRTVRHEKRYISGVAMLLFSCLTVL